MKKYCMVFFLLFFLATALNPALAADWTGNVNFPMGVKSLDSDDWKPVEDHSEFGIDVDFRRWGWPVNVVIALSSSYDDEFVYGTDTSGIVLYGTEVEATTTEFKGGIRKIWEPNDYMRPFLGGGVTLISAEFEAYHLSDDDLGVGPWFGGGIYWTLGASFNLGFNLEYSYAEVTLFDYDANAGGGHAALILGYHW